MKTAISLILVAFATSTLALADPSPSSSPAQEHPCQKISSSCEAAGFTQGGHKNGQNKGLGMDCFGPIMHGKSVPGVTVSSDDVNACKNNMKKFRGKRRERRQNRENQSQS